MIRIIVFVCVAHDSTVKGVSYLLAIILALDFFSI